MFSEKAKDIMDACRFCWMCRHTCPVAAVTGNEANTPRARGLVLSMDSRGIPYTQEAIDVVYQCILCSACTNNCVTGYDPPVFTREARSVAIARDFLPPWLDKIVEKALDGELAFVNEPENDAYRKIKKQISSEGKYVLYRGGYTASTVNLLQVLLNAKIDVSIVEDELPTGSHLGDLIGYVEDVRIVAEQWVEQMSKTNASTVIVLNPTDAAFIKQQLGEWGVPMPFKVVSATAFVTQLLEEGKLKVRQNSKEVTFHDSSRQTRILDDVATPRTIIKHSGATLTETFLHGKLVTSAGSVIIQMLYPSIQDKLVKARWEELMRTGVPTVVTASPENRAMLGTNVPEGYEIVDIFSLLLD
jgi:Fe-S oxidoreductase